MVTKLKRKPLRAQGKSGHHNVPGGIRKSRESSTVPVCVSPVYRGARKEEREKRRRKDARKCSRSGCGGGRMANPRNGWMDGWDRFFTTAVASQGPFHARKDSQHKLCWANVEMPKTRRQWVSPSVLLISFPQRKAENTQNNFSVRSMTSHKVEKCTDQKKS